MKRRKRSLASRAPGRTVGLSMPRKNRRGITIVPFIGDLVAMTRLLRSRESKWWAKLLAVAAIVYVICPVDLVPDVAPVVGWLDDVGVVLFVRILLWRALTPYRYPLFEKPPVEPPVLEQKPLDARASTP